MDHRWDDSLRQEHGRRAEQSRFGTRRIERDRDVERRDRLEAARRASGHPRGNKSPWEIGAAHWDQRDLYTRNSDVSDSGYGRGPSYHPKEGSYAYHRDVVPPSAPAAPLEPGDEPTLYEREAWPWLHYHERMQPLDAEHGLWGRMKHEASSLFGKLTGHPHVHGLPRGWWRADGAIHDDVCDALAYAGDLDAREIEVEVKDAEVWLRGTVRERAQKRLAEELTENVRGVVDVHNRLTVRKDDDDLALSAPVAAY
jgi:hypothetical protein